MSEVNQVDKLTKDIALLNLEVTRVSSSIDEVISNSSKSAQSVSSLVELVSDLQSGYSKYHRELATQLSSVSEMCNQVVTTISSESVSHDHYITEISNLSSQYSAVVERLDELASQVDSKVNQLSSNEHKVMMSNHKFTEFSKMIMAGIMLMFFLGVAIGSITLFNLQSIGHSVEVINVLEMILGYIMKLAFLVTLGYFCKAFGENILKILVSNGVVSSVATSKLVKSASKVVSGVDDSSDEEIPTRLDSSVASPPI